MYAVIFDFDGVLADTESLHMLALQQAFAGRGWTLTEADYLTRYLGYDDRGVVAAFVAAEGIQVTPRDAAGVLADKQHRYAGLLATSQVLFPGTRACIQRLADVFPLAIASGSLRGEIEHILAANDLRDAFKAIVGADDVRAGKPAPDSYLRAAQALGVEGAQALAIEDSPMGLQSARSAGLVTIGVTTSCRPEALTGADHIIASLDEVTVSLVRTLLARGNGAG